MRCLALLLVVVGGVACATAGRAGGVSPQEQVLEVVADSLSAFAQVAQRSRRGKEAGLDLFAL